MHDFPQAPVARDRLILTSLALAAVSAGAFAAGFILVAVREQARAGVSASR